MLHIELITEFIEEGCVRSGIEIPVLIETRIESILRDSHMLAHDASEEGHLRKVSLHLLDEVFAQNRQVLDARASGINQGIGAEGVQNLLVFLHLRHVVIVPLWVSSQLVADAVQMYQHRLKSSNQLLIHLLLPRHEPGTFLGC